MTRCFKTISDIFNYVPNICSLRVKRCRVDVEPASPIMVETGWNWLIHGEYINSWMRESEPTCNWRGARGPTFQLRRGGVGDSKIQTSRRGFWWMIVVVFKISKSTIRNWCILKTANSDLLWILYILIDWHMILHDLTVTFLGVIRHTISSVIRNLPATDKT